MLLACLVFISVRTLHGNGLGHATYTLKQNGPNALLTPRTKRDISIRMSFSFCFFRLLFHLLLIFFCTATEPVTRPWGRYTKQRNGMELVRGDSFLLAFVIGWWIVMDVIFILQL